jgi:arginine decarboxylase-like protein
VFGKTKDEKIKMFETVKNHDLQKQIICQEKGIGLYIVDVSKYKRATKEGDNYYLELVKDCIIESM